MSLVWQYYVIISTEQPQPAHQKEAKAYQEPPQKQGDSHQEQQGQSLDFKT